MHIQKHDSLHFFYIPSNLTHSSMGSIWRKSASAGELLLRVEPHWQLDTIRQNLLKPIIFQQFHLHLALLPRTKQPRCLNQPRLLLLHSTAAAADGELRGQSEAGDGLLGNNWAADSCLKGWGKSV